MGPTESSQTSSPTASPSNSSNEVSITVDVVLDSDARDVSWKIMDILAQNVTTHFQPGFYSAPGFYP
jgi:hypothetical protein